MTATEKNILIAAQNACELAEDMGDARLPARSDRLTAERLAQETHWLHRLISGAQIVTEEMAVAALR